MDREIQYELKKLSGVKPDSFFNYEYYCCYSSFLP